MTRENSRCSASPQKEMEPIPQRDQRLPYSQVLVQPAALWSVLLGDLEPIIDAVAWGLCASSSYIDNIILCHSPQGGASLVWISSWIFLLAKNTHFVIKNGKF